MLSVAAMLTSLGKRLLVVNNGNVRLGQVDDLLVLDLPQVLGDLRDESCTPKSADHTASAPDILLALSTHGSRAKQ
jgi:hypothetical protein